MSNTLDHIAELIGILGTTLMFAMLFTWLWSLGDNTLVAMGLIPAIMVTGFNYWRIVWLVWLSLMIMETIAYYVRKVVS